MGLRYKFYYFYLDGNKNDYNDENTHNSSSYHETHDYELENDNNEEDNIEEQVISWFKRRLECNCLYILLSLLRLTILNHHHLIYE